MEIKMKITLELQGQIFDSRQSLCDRFGVSVTTLLRWRKKGLLPPPLRLGKANYYCREAVEARLARGHL
jgi:DNA-binding transcriptional MerR regulator